MNELRHPQGRRRAHVPPQRGSLTPAPASMLAPMWAAVSAVHGVLESRRRYFENTDTDVRLGDQLSLLPMLDGWYPLTTGEVEELTYLLRAYADASEDEIHQEAARLVVMLIRSMAEQRAHRGGADGLR